MIRLIKLEWSKFSKNNILQILSLFYFLFFPACLYFGSLIPDLPSFLPNKKTFFQFPEIWDYLGYAGNWITFFFIGVMAIYLVTIEVSNKTMRQSIINGLRRNEFFSSKLISISIICFIGSLYYYLLGMIIGLSNAESLTISGAFTNDWAFFRFFLMSFAYCSFAIFLAYLFRTSGLAIFFYVSYIMIMEPLMRYVIINQIDKASFTRFFPMNAAEDLMPFPVFRYANAIPDNIDFAFLLTYGEAAIASIIYCIIFLLSSYYIFLRRDV